MSDIVLLPCPWCGSKAEIRNSLLGYEYRVSCSNKECDEGLFWERTPEESAAHWNARAPSDPTPQMFDGAAAQLAALLEQDAQEALDLLTVWEWATHKRHWCDDVRLHVSGVHFEIAEPKEGKTKAERRPEIHRFTHYTSDNGSLRNALHAAAAFCRERKDGDFNRYAQSLLPEPSDDAKAMAEAFETFLLMAGERVMEDGSLSKLARMFDSFAAQHTATLRKTLEEWVAAYENEPDYQRGVADVLAFINGDIS